MNKIIGIVLLGLVLATLAPLVFLWSLNTLFAAAGTALYIPHTFSTYVACFGVFSCLRGG